MGKKSEFKIKPAHDSNEIGTPQLDAFLGGARMRRLHGAELRAHLQRLFAPEIAAPLPEETMPARIFALWRVTRAMAIVKGLCAPEQTLDDSTEILPDPWTCPFKPMVGPSEASALRRGRASYLAELSMQGEGLPLLPPSDEQERDDPGAMHRWCRSAAVLIQDLGMHRYIEDDGVDSAAVEWMLDEASARQCDVTAGHILALEAMLIDEAQELIMEYGERPAVQHFREEQGLTKREALDLVRLARVEALREGGSSVEEDRAVMVVLIKNFLSRAKDSMNMDDELKALKELAKIQGLTRTAPEDMAREFFKVVEAVSSENDRKLAAAAPRLVLPPSEEIPYRVLGPKSVPEDEEDAEALAQFDSENQ